MNKDKITMDETNFVGQQANSWVLVPRQEADDPEQVQYDNVRYDKFVQQLFKADTEHMMALHAALGVCGEAGELADAMKKEYVYRKPRDFTNIIEELGDLLFYVHSVMNHYQISEQEVLQQNALKLAKRYMGLKYTDQAAQDRADKKMGG